MIRNVSRRQLLWVSSAGLAAAAVGGWAGAPPSRAQAVPAAPASPPPVTARIGRRIRLHMFQTGWVSVKAPHKAYSGPSGLRLPAILASQTWTPWLPVTAFAIEHPEGLFVVDTGETVRMLSADYSACDAGTGFFYRRNLRFALGADDELGPQMRRAGLAPENVRTVVMTHLHSDHMGGMGHFPQADFLVSERARTGHQGALMCRIPSGLRLRAATLETRAAGVFAASHSITADGAISIVPTPGHATGHQSVLVAADGASVCLAGDAAFSLEQIETGEIGGIVENVADTRASAAALKDQRAAFGTVILPTHDPDNAAHLQRL